MQFKYTKIISYLFILGCSITAAFAGSDIQTAPTEYHYQISTGDNLNIFVWRNPELSISLPVRPDGRISLPLINELKVVGETPDMLAKLIEKKLAKYIKQPVVSVMVMGFGPDYSRSIKIIGGSLEPISIPFTENLYLLNVMVKLGGLKEQSAGSRAKILRRAVGSFQESDLQNNAPQKIEVDLDALLNDGDLKQNVLMRPGDILLIPERWF